MICRLVQLVKDLVDGWLKGINVVVKKKNKQLLKNESTLFFVVFF